MENNFATYRKWQPFLLGICAALGLWAGLNMRQVEHPGTSVEKSKAVYSDQSQKLKDVISYVQSKYLDTINAATLTDVALGTFISNLDPFSEYIPSDLMHKYSDQIQGKIRGIGIRLTDLDSQLIVGPVQVKSPAAYAGISTGDYLFEIDKQPVLHVSLKLDSIEDAIENHKSDSILIKWKHRENNEIKEQNIALEELDDHPVSDVYNPDKKILYLRLRQISKDSYREFMNALEQCFQSRQCKHLIIDLRDNSGGLIHEAAFILNQLINEKDVMMFKTSGIKVKDKEYRTTGKPFFNIEKIAVLVNHETASAAELIAATLQDLDRAIVIGTPTFGKSTVLEQFSLGDGSAIRLAISRYYTSSGRSIQRDYEHNLNISYLGNSGRKSDSVYYSLKKKKLATHQGVVPDFIVFSEDSVNAERTLYSDFADKLVARHFAEFKSLLQNNPDNINQVSKITQLIKDELVANSLLSRNAKRENELEQECKYALARWFFTDELEHRMRLLNDEGFAIAIRELNK